MYELLEKAKNILLSFRSKDPNSRKRRDLIGRPGDNHWVKTRGEGRVKQVIGREKRSKSGKGLLAQLSPERNQQCLERKIKGKTCKK